MNETSNRTHEDRRVLAEDASIDHKDTILASRVWNDRELLSETFDLPTTKPAIKYSTCWSSLEAAQSYQRGEIPLARTLVISDRSEALFDWPTLLSDGAPKEPLPPAAIIFGVGFTGLFLDPSKLVWVTADLTGETPLFSTGEPTRPDVRVSGPGVDIIDWLAGRLQLTDVYEHINIDGDYLLLGTVVGLLRMTGGFSIPESIAYAGHKVLELVELHRSITDNTQVYGV